jgi:hypothetical protein
LKEKLLALFCNEEISDKAFGQQEKMIGGVTLVCDYRIGEESALRCSCQDCLAIRRIQSIEELCSQVQ